MKWKVKKLIIKLVKFLGEKNFDLETNQNNETTLTYFVKAI